LGVTGSIPVGQANVKVSMVAVAQLVESRIVIPVVVGSSPISHPIFSPDLQNSKLVEKIGSICQ
jgi:hypothetical protein